MKNRLCPIILVVSLLSNWVVFIASAASLKIEKTLTKADGLTSDTVLAILEDNRGTMWFGTTHGLTRYDGKNFQTFTTKDGLASNTVGFILQDRHGMLWCGDGVLSSVLEREKPVDISLMEMSLSDLAKLSITERIIDSPGTRQPKGISHYDGREFQIFTTIDGLAHNTVKNIFQDKTGLLWFATGNGVSQYDHKQFNNIIVDGSIGMNVLPEAWNDVKTVVQDTSGNFWFGNDAGITYYNVRTSQTRFFAVNNELKPFVEMDQTPSGHVNALEFDENKYLWIGRIALYEQDSGVCRYDGKKLVTFPTKEQLPMNNVNNILRDSRDNLWFTGTKRLPPTPYETEQGKYMVREEIGVGISVYNGKTFQNFSTADGLPHARVWSVFEDSNGKFWFATDAGVAVGVYLSSQNSDN